MGASGFSDLLFDGSGSFLFFFFFCGYLPFAATRSTSYSCNASKIRVMFLVTPPH